jgi:antitoxin ParD1/3/4
MPTMNVSLPKPLVDFVEDEVSSGAYATASEVVRDALRLLRRSKALEAERSAILRREIAVGLEDAREGRLSGRSISEIAEAVGSEAAAAP